MPSSPRVPDKKPLLEQLAGLLLEREVLEGEELRRVIRAMAESQREPKSAMVH
jgi:hypothetical protein